MSVGFSNFLQKRVPTNLPMYPHIWETENTDFLLTFINGALFGPQDYL